MSYRRNDLDIALDFANLHRRDNKFCADMLRVFELYGKLTHSQVAAILRIRDQRGL